MNKINTKFKVGDIVVPNERADVYSITNRREECVCIVEGRIDANTIEVKVLSNKNSTFIGSRHIVKESYFDSKEKEKQYPIDLLKQGQHVHTRNGNIYLVLDNMESITTNKAGFVFIRQDNFMTISNFNKELKYLNSEADIVKITSAVENLDKSNMANSNLLNFGSYEYVVWEEEKIETDIVHVQNFGTGEVEIIINPKDYPSQSNIQVGEVFNVLFSKDLVKIVGIDKIQFDNREKLTDFEDRYRVLGLRVATK